MGRKRLPVIGYADRDVRLSVCQVRQLPRRQDLHLDVRVQVREFGEIGHEQVGREGRRHRHPQKPARTLVATEDARLQSVRRSLHLAREFENLLTRRRRAVARGQFLEQLCPEALLKLRDAPKHGRMVYPEPHGCGPDRAAARDGKEVADVIPVDHGAIQHRERSGCKACIQPVG